jgi:hypothetical protein
VCFYRSHSENLLRGILKARGFRVKSFNNTHEQQTIVRQR